MGAQKHSGMYHDQLHAATDCGCNIAIIQLRPRLQYADGMGVHVSGLGGEPVKTIIAGSRDGVTADDVANALMIPDRDWDITKVVSGTARGVDTFGEEWAARWNVPVIRMPANWDEHGKSAGYIRNMEMAAYADALVAIWDGKSKGTKHMIDCAKKMDLRVVVHMVGVDNAP